MNECIPLLYNPVQVDCPRCLLPNHSLYDTYARLELNQHVLWGHSHLKAARLPISATGACAESEGFEPPVVSPTLAFEASAISLSTNSPELRTPLLD